MRLVVLLTLAGCAGPDPAGPGPGAAALRGFGIEVDRAVAPRVPTVRLRTCGSWGCHEQEVALIVSGTASALPCPSAPAAADTACGAVVPSGPGPGHGYAPVPGLTLDQVTVRVTTPPGAPFPISAEVSVRPAGVCPGPGGGAASPAPRATCSGGTPQARLRIAADGTVSQIR